MEALNKNFNKFFKKQFLTFNLLFFKAD